MPKLGEIKEKNRNQREYKKKPDYTNCGTVKKGLIKKTDVQYLIARLHGYKRKDALATTDLVDTGRDHLKRANAIERRMADPNSALNQAFDKRGISADVLAGYALELLQAETIIKKRTLGGEVLERIPDNRTRLAALELVVKLRNMMVAKQDKGGDTNITFEQNIIMASELLDDPEAVRKLLGKAKTITAEYKQVEE